jgi:pimeloyl-ACP methyl ester carboxylesterase
LSFLFAAQNPALVKKLILIASGPFEEKDAQNIMKTRLNRMSEKERTEALLLMDALERPTVLDKDKVLMRLGKLISKSDSYDPIPQNSSVLMANFDTFQSVWGQAEELRSSGQLINYGRKIKCPVVAIHGDFDPHPAEGIRRPLSRILKDFRFILLKNCGHTPWTERLAKDQFYKTINKELY